MITTEQIKTAILTWMARETGMTCIFARQGKPRPKLPYGSILVVNHGVRVGGIDEIRGEATEVAGSPAYIYKQNGLRTCMVSLNIYGENANALMAKLRDSLDRPDVIEEMEKAKLAFIREEGPNDLTELEDTKYTERSQIDLTFQYALERETTVVPILEAEVEATITTDTQTEIINNFEVVTTLP